MAKGKAKIRYVVKCDKHGAESKFWAGRMVQVSRPTNARVRMSGCPICAAEARKALIEEMEACE